jgi:hypothetical protein
MCQPPLASTLVGQAEASAALIPFPPWSFLHPGMSILDTINPSLTRYRRDEPAPVLPLRDEPDLLSLLEASGRLVADEETAGTEVSTVEEEELSALMGEKEDYNQPDEQAEEDWED